MQKNVDNEITVFFALPLQPHTDMCKRLLLPKVAPLIESPWRLIDVCRWHITVVYIGKIKPPLLQDMLGDVAEVCSGLHSFEVSIENIIYLPDNRPSVMAWQVGLSAELSNLYHLLSECIGSYGVGDIRPVYRPHISFARSKKRLTSFKSMDISLEEPVRINIAELCCMQSAVLSRHDPYSRYWSQQLL